MPPQPMKLGVAFTLFAALVGCATSAVTSGTEVTNPVSRVVGLLKGLKEKLEADFEAEKTLYENYECWYKSIVKSKSASNLAANSRIDSLVAYIADIEAGKIEFTTERVDLEKQIAELKDDLEVADAQRASEEQNYEAAVAELQAALTALTAAIQALQDGAPASMLAKSSRLGSFPARDSLFESLRLGRSLLSSSDARLLERLASGDVPQPDWKKLNRKATFKAKYTTQTAGIVKTLKDLNTTFAENLQEAESKEQQSKAMYDELTKGKNNMKEKAEAALVEMVEEGAARGLSKSEAQEEVDDLREQVTADEAFIGQVETAYETKKGEWTERERLRQLEISAISEAISVLHSDDARDTFKTSFKSQGYSFLQASGWTAPEKELSINKQIAAVRVLKALAAKSKDSRLVMLADSSSRAGVATKSISVVIEKIDELMQTLAGEEKDDLAKKEVCESQRAEKTRQAKTQSVAVDDLTDEIVRARAKSEELSAQIKEQEATIEEMNETLVEMERQREDEKTLFNKNKADDLLAVQLVDQAILIMEYLKGNMTGSGGAALVKVGAHVHEAETPSAEAAVPATPRSASSLAPVASRLRGGNAVVADSGGKQTQAMSLLYKSKQPVEVAAGEAPPPPPTTWSDPTYTGASGESAGVASILALIKEDIEKDISTAVTEEEEAQAAYDKEKGELDEAVLAAQSAISSLEEGKAAEDQKAVDKGSERVIAKTDLDTTMEQIKALSPGCDFLLVNIRLRTKKRQMEMDGLIKTKAILQGAGFE